MFVNAIDCVNISNSANIKYISFRSDNISNPKLKSDSVEISSPPNKKKEGMSDGMKLLLGIGGTGVALYGILVMHRAVTKPSLEDLQKDFKEIFRRNVSLDEIPEMLKKYKKILNIKDEKEFCEKAFEQVKKDYGYGDLNIKMNLNEATDNILGGGWASSGGDFTIYYKNIIKHNGNIFDRQTKANILGTLFHEFQHAKQTEYCVRTDLDKYVNSLINEKLLNETYIANTKSILNNKERLAETAKKFNLTEEQTLEQAKKELEILKTQGYKAIPAYVNEVNIHLNIIKNRLNELFGKYEKFKPGSDEYKMGEKYTKNYGSYINAQKDSTNEDYKAQLIEKEAFNVERLSKHIPKRLRSSWNIFSF